MKSVDVPLFVMPAECSVAGCVLPVLNKRLQLCDPHYKRHWRYGDPLAGGPMRPRSDKAKPVIDFPDGTRQCNLCALRLPLESFHKDAGGKNGRRSRCSDCHRAKSREWYDTNRDRQASRQLERRRADIAAHRKWDAERYERDRDKRIALATQQSHKRRLRLLQGEYDQTVTRANLRKQYGDDCFYCGQSMDFYRYTHTTRPRSLATLEHIEPVSRGGAHTWTNVVLACLDCNVRKNATPLDEWLGRTA